MDYRIETTAAVEAVLFAREELLRAFQLLRAPRMSVQLLADDYETDGFTVDMNFPDGHGFIKGSNPRSVLFGVYRLLRELGFRWVRPGASGEVVPPPPEKWPYIRAWEQASAKLRAICIEGAVSRENLLDTIEWMARHYFNTYYLQADSAYAFLERYYRHLGNPLLPPEALSREDAAAITEEVIAALRKRGLVLEQFGHGPTCEILGLSHWGWDPELQPITDQIKPCLAQINGVRDLWHHNPKYTQLCYGNPEIRERLADRMVQLISEHPEAGLVNFFLSDHHHNFCECELCRGKRPADWYVMILNLIDNRLTRMGNKIRIGFAVYYDLLWPPENEKINNPDRFFLVACPVTRSYSEPLGIHGSASGIPEYLPNISPYPQSGKETLAFYDAWRAVFPGECVIFDYHYMWDLHRDYSGYALPRVLHADVSGLRAIGMSGFISCQNQRAFYPNGLGMAVMAAGLWHDQTEFEVVARDYFKSAYGDDGFAAAQKYFQQVESFFPVRLLRGEGGDEKKLQAAALLGGEIPEKTVQAVMPAIEAGLKLENQIHHESWAMLKLHTEQLLLACKAFSVLWGEGADRAGAHISKLFDWARAHEMRLQSVFDVYEYLSVSITVTGVDRNIFMNRLDTTSHEADLAEI